MILNLKLELDRQQLQGVDYIIKHKYVLVGDAPGVGKTPQALAIATTTKGKSLVVVPAGLRKNWEHEVKKFTYLKPKIIKSKKDLVNFKKYDVFIISYHFLKHSEDLFNVCDTVICDEAHAIKNFKTQKAKALDEFLWKYKPTYFVPMTGTPVENRVPELYNLLVLLSYNINGTNGERVLDTYATQYEFNKEFCKKKMIKVNGRQITQWYGFQKQKKGRLRKLLRGKYFRRKEVIGLNVSYRTKDVYVDFKKDPTLQKEWEQFVKHSEMTPTAKADSAYNKADFTVDYAKRLHEEIDGPMVIFTDHLKSYEYLTTTLSKHFKVAGIVGGMDIDQKDKNNQDFQNGKLEILVITRAGREGLNLYKAQHLIFNDYPWVPGHIDQIIKRIYRKGQTKHCVIHNIFGSYQDARIRKTLDEKIKVLEEIL